MNDLTRYKEKLRSIINNFTLEYISETARLSTLHVNEAYVWIARERDRLRRLSNVEGYIGEYLLDGLKKDFKRRLK